MMEPGHTIHVEISQEALKPLQDSLDKMQIVAETWRVWIEAGGLEIPQPGKWVRDLDE